MKILILISNILIIFIDDVLIYSSDIDQHFKHIKIFIKLIKHNGLVVSKTKINVFRTEVRFLGHNIHSGTIISIKTSIEFENKFPLQLTNKNQLPKII